MSPPPLTPLWWLWTVTVLYSIRQRKGRHLLFSWSSLCSLFPSPPCLMMNDCYDYYYYSCIFVGRSLTALPNRSRPCGHNSGHGTLHWFAVTHQSPFPCQDHTPKCAMYGTTKVINIFLGRGGTMLLSKYNILRDGRSDIEGDHVEQVR